MKMFLKRFIYFDSRICCREIKSYIIMLVGGGGGGDSKGKGTEICVFVGADLKECIRI